MESEIRGCYRALRAEVVLGTPITVLQIGTEQTALACGLGPEAEAVMVLSIGSRRTATDCFQHWPPTPAELENAIMVVEDELTRARALVVGPSTLLSSDKVLRQIGQRAGGSDQPRLALSLEAVERQFELLAALSQGRPLASAGIPDQPAWAATLLILRELMHHLQFPAITLASSGVVENGS